MKILLLYIFVSILLVSCASTVRFTDNISNSSLNTKPNASSGTQPNDLPAGYTFRGKASYYSDKFHGRSTASGDIFDQNKLTAAHRSLPFGTKLKVINLKNSRSVVVIINDRGPFVEGRIIDLSYEAARQLDMLQDGIADVECTILD
ncbi:MAG: septal ring lytic transglycosylase RlpA family protein [Ignavibacteria bacterium]|nr:septal ring lytic transglycosylase RlpA family protein [Ignavibacteria bacterium]